MITAEAIAKIIAINYAEWHSYLGKAQKVIQYINQEKELDLFERRRNEKVRD